MVNGKNKQHKEKTRQWYCINVTVVIIMTTIIMKPMRDRMSRLFDLYCTAHSYVVAFCCCFFFLNITAVVAVSDTIYYFLPCPLAPNQYENIIYRSHIKQKFTYLCTFIECLCVSYYIKM